jgi:excisionase family DNA binding protein
MPRKLARKAVPDVNPNIQEPEEEEAPAEGEWKPTPLLYNVGDACFILGKISKQMLYRLIHEGQITPVKIGTRSLFTMEKLERFVSERIQEQSAVG